MVHIQSVYIRKYFSTSRTQFEFTSGVNCLPGGNSSGKTTLVAAINFTLLGPECERFTDKRGDVFVSFFLGDESVTFHRINDEESETYTVDGVEKTFEEYKKDIEAIGIKSQHLPFLINFESYEYFVEESKKLANLVELMNPKSVTLLEEREEIMEKAQLKLRLEQISRKRKNVFNALLPTLSTELTKNYKDLCANKEASLTLISPNAQSPKKNLQLIAKDSPSEFFFEFSGGQRTKAAKSVLFALIKEAGLPFLIIDNMEDRVHYESLEEFASGVQKVAHRAGLQLIITSRRTKFSDLIGHHVKSTVFLY
ncbi:hypothetical protein L5515_019475 [Caenorhabditis briggsae]|uniref:RecF/RecN/SMC N-terminal domain-containing protein n=1 Tax=Caenorhabditis briggsae TaxID=6238 RepID=A0AAE9FLW0_CAEBR|nr:hypothetical protein L5515_019475 [Caenorhabditis briggsae]